MRNRLTIAVMSALLTMSVVGLAPASASGRLPGNGLVAVSRADFDHGGYGLWLVNPDGSNQRQFTAGFEDHNPSWSPSGRQLAFDRDGSLVVSTLRGSVHQITPDGTDPTWSPDGRQLAFTRAGAIFRIGRTGGAATPLTSPPGGCTDGHPAWSPTGVRLLFSRTCAGNRSVSLLNVASGQVHVLTADGLLDRRDVIDSFDWMPDGRHVALTARCVAHGRCLPGHLADVMIVATGSPNARRPVTDARAVAARHKPSCSPEQFCWSGYWGVVTSPDGRAFLVHNSMGNVGCLDTTLRPEGLCRLAAGLVGAMEAAWQPLPTR